MSRFSDPSRTGSYTLPGDCLCPGAPHVVEPDPTQPGAMRGPDWVELRLEAGAADMAAMFITGTNVGVLRTLAVKWNLLGDDGEPAPLNADNIGRLFGDNFDDLDAWIDEHVQMASVPKASGEPSSSGTPETDRPNRAARRQRRSTKP